MRRLLLGLVLLAACGTTDPNGGSGGGDNNSAECRQAYSAFHSVVDPRQLCTVDSDCRVVLDNCFGPAFCATYVNVANADAARAALADGQKACQCAVCNAPPPPACVDGVCDSKFALCQSLERHLSDIAAANQSCTQDADCHFVADIRTDTNTQRSCNTFVNSAGLAEMTALQDRYSMAGCPSPCTDNTPHCSASGSCAAP